MVSHVVLRDRSNFSHEVFPMEIGGAMRSI